MSFCGLCKDGCVIRKCHSVVCVKTVALLESVILCAFVDIGALSESVILLLM